MNWMLLAFAAAAAVGRAFIAPRLADVPSIEGTYEALAHLLVGFLILVPFYDRDQQVGPSRIYGRIGWALAFWEAGWFAVQKLHHG